MAGFLNAGYRRQLRGSIRRQSLKDQTGEHGRTGAILFFESILPWLVRRKLTPVEGPLPAPFTEKSRKPRASGSRWIGDVSDFAIAIEKGLWEWAV
jgi:hypothetical protein